MTTVRDWITDLVAGNVTAAEVAERVRAYDWSDSADYDTDWADPVAPSDTSWDIINTDPRISVADYQVLAQAYLESQGVSTQAATHAFKFNPNQPRDDNGRWGDGDGLAGKIWNSLSDRTDGDVLLTSRKNSPRRPFRLIKASDDEGNFIRIGVQTASGEWNDDWGKIRDEEKLRSTLDKDLFAWDAPKSTTPTNTPSLPSAPPTKTHKKTTNAPDAKTPPVIESSLPEKSSDSHSDDALTKSITAATAVTMQNQMYAPSKWSTKQRSAVQRYTDNAFESINAYLRGDSDVSGSSVKSDITALNSLMRPSTRDVTLYRGIFGPEMLGVSSLTELKTLVGKTGTTRGFSSTRLQRDKGHGAYCGTCITLNIRAPKGTKMAYIASHSTNPHEEEMLLPSGVRYRIIGVEEPAKKGSPWQLTMEVVSDE